MKEKFEKLGRELSQGSWNYRIQEKTYRMTEEQKKDYITSMKQIFGEDYEVSEDSFVDTFYDIIEVYYTEDGKILGWTEGSAAPWRKRLRRFNDFF